MKTICLLVEDNPTDVYLFKRVLATVDHQATLIAVHTGEEAIDLLTGDGKYCERLAYPFPSLMFLDLDLPGIKGENVLRWLKHSNLPAPLFVIALTGAPQTKKPSLAFETAGGVTIFGHHLLKPINHFGMSMSFTLFDAWRSRSFPAGTEPPTS